jgi:dTDP-4-dehydrorhamnose 3,5-epimerase
VGGSLCYSNSKCAGVALKFIPTAFEGAYIIDVEPKEDERGFFARSWCVDELRALGLVSNLMQCSVSFNKKRGTLRGMHYQGAPHEETKIVRCTAGSIFDVIVDMRPESATFKQWLSFELSAENRSMVYVPTGVAHGFQSLADNTEVFYMVSEFYHPESSCSVRWNDPQFAIEWPHEEHRVISSRDSSYPDFVL